MPPVTSTASGCEFPGNPPNPGGGPGPCGSYEVAVVSSTDAAVNCSNEMNGDSEIVKAWQYNLDYNFGNLNSLRFGMQAHHALTFRFKTPSVTEANAAEFGGWFPHGGSVLTTEQVNRGGIPGMHVSISEKRCDFRRAALPGGTAYSPCHSTSNNASILFNYKVLGNTTDPNDPNICTLRPDKYYYLNIRYENAAQSPGNTACTSAYCGLNFQIN
jgi:hypothetical protein